MKQGDSDPAGGPFLIRLLCVALVVLVIPVLAWNGFVQQFNADLNDILLRLRRPVQGGAKSNIVLVAIDDKTAASDGPLPLKRATLAAGLRRLTEYRPRVIALDLLLSEPTQADDDRALSATLESAPAAILSAALRSDPGADSTWIAPLPEFAGLHRVAHVHVAPDADGHVRAILLTKLGNGRRYWALGLEAARLALNARAPLESRDAVELGPIRILASESTDRMMLINYAGPEGAFSRVSFASLLRGDAKPEDFRDKIVFLGVTAQGTGDRLFTPVSAGLGMSGIEIHANIARTILDRAFLVPLTFPVELGLLFFIGAVCWLCARYWCGRILFIALVGVGLGIVAFAAIALGYGHVWPLGAMLAVFVFSAAISGVGENATLAISLRSSERKRREYAFRVQAIAHEIKTPLTAIQGSSEIISDRLLPEEQRHQIAGMIHKESKRLTEIVHTFLDVERMAAGSLEIQKRPTDLHVLCEEVVERARLYAARKKIQIVTDLPPINVAADADLLSFAIYNLLTNAIKYSPKQTSVSLLAGEQQQTISIAVVDQGYGIAPGEQKKVFERFYRLGRDRIGAEEGSGIGLALVQEIVAQHGGSIKVESREGAGSSFTIVLPKNG